MRTQSRVEFLLPRAALLLLLGWTLQAAAGIHVERFGYSKFVLGPNTGTSFVDTFDDGGPLINPDPSLGAFEWQIRIGTIKDKDEDSGLQLKPWRRGAPFAIGSYMTRAQVLELQTPLDGPGAIDNTPLSFFNVFGTYEIDSYMSDRQVFFGIGLTDVFRGGGTRAIAATIEREGGSYYGKFSNALTGEIFDRHLLEITPETKYVEVFIERDGPNSDSVRGGYGFLDEDRNLIFGSLRQFNGLQLAFSDVVLSPVLFAAVPIPEPETWALLIAGLAVIGWRVGSRRR